MRLHVVCKAGDITASALVRPVPATVLAEQYVGPRPACLREAPTRCMWFTGYCCGVNGARTAAVGHGDDGQNRQCQPSETGRAGMGCTPSILSNGSNNQQQSRKDSGLYVGNVAAASGNGSSESNAANNNKLSSHSTVNATMVNASYPGAASKDGGAEKIR
uniref:Uncharacterized protein n=1 Tax=Anopheles atroparvus TaxID=41427 RepID=A0A182JEL3_ANOAO